MNAIIQPGRLSGTVRPPASKSMMQRICAAALLYGRETRITNPGTSADDEAALRIIRQLGATVSGGGEEVLQVRSSGLRPAAAIIDCGESGLSTRLFAPVAALHDGPLTLTGHGSLRQRPMDAFEAVLPQLGVALPGFAGTVPFTVTGPLRARDLEVDGSLSSQFLTGLLFALCAAAKAPVTVRATELKSRPYVDMTLDVLSRFGRPVLEPEPDVFHIYPARFTPPAPTAVAVESDWSSAGYWIAGAALAGDLTVAGMNRHSRQADAALLSVVATRWETDEHLHIREQALPGFQFDATHCPDLFPTLAILAACAAGTSTLHGTHRLLAKESNRLASVCAMLDAFGVPHQAKDDRLVIEGTGRLKAATIDAWNDHRIAMAAAIGALRADGPVVIRGAEAVAKSYPRFFTDLQALGIRAALTD